MGCQDDGPIFVFERSKGAAAPAAKTAPQVRSTSSRCGSSKGPPMASDGAAGVAPNAKSAAPLEVLLSGRP